MQQRDIQRRNPHHAGPYPQNHRKERENPKPGSQKQSPYDKQIQRNKKTGQTSAKGRKCGQQILSVNDKDRICRSTVHG